MEPSSTFLKTIYSSLTSHSHHFCKICAHECNFPCLSILTSYWNTFPRKVTFSNTRIIILCYTRGYKLLHSDNSRIWFFTKPLPSFTSSRYCHKQLLVARSVSLKWYTDCSKSCLFKVAEPWNVTSFGSNGALWAWVTVALLQKDVPREVNRSYPHHRLSGLNHHRHHYYKYCPLTVARFLSHFVF